MEPRCRLGFIFVSEDGSISGWNPTLDQTHAIIAVDNGTNNGINSAIYKGATLGVANGHNFLYVTDFHTGKVETFDENFHQVNPNGFVDPNLPAGYGPFGIRNFNGEIFVTYAKQDHKREDDVACAGCGFVNVFDTSGNFLRRLISNGESQCPVGTCPGRWRTLGWQFWGWSHQQLRSDDRRFY